MGLVKFALDNGQPIDSVINGVLPIHAACCSNGNVAVVLFLIERGADVNSRRFPRKYSSDRVVGAQTVGTTGSTPLHFAAANGCLTIVEILLRHGATPDLADKYGSTPYTVATARNHPDVAALLHMHLSMQRGLQVTTPDLDICDSRNGDPFTSPRSSGDFSRRISAVMAPTRSGLESSSRPLPSRISTDVSFPPSAALGKVPHNIYQRRVSLPCIIESPSSPVASNLPRQSCDLGRPPLSTELLHSRNKSTDSHFSGAPSRLSNIFSLTKTQQPVTVQTALPSSADNTPAAPKPAESAPVAPGGRRRSVDLLGTGFLSPRIALAVNRRKSLDQLRAVPPVLDAIIPEGRTADSKTRRDSGASTSGTMVSSDLSSCSTLVNPMIAMTGNDSRTQLDKIQSPSSSPASNVTLAEASETKGPTANIISVSSLAALRRGSSASEPGVRSSLDLRSMTSPHHHEVDMKARHRRSMQEPLDASFFSPPLASASSFQNKMDNSSNNSSYTKHRASFSGSATVSGRFSRFWSYASGRESPEPSAIHSKDNSVGTLESVVSNNSNEAAPWTMSDMGDGHYFTEKDFPASGRRSRNGVMNRLSGLWSRR
ncbi:hypothetical protein EC957_010498 [Mortierella hygrophila]|uniref:protein S-acyltransferase n=1 Tax=Mortierella hygrophila TaxID=979708 RepID=A0A9P6F8X2_9FUNG|nr:hypothetical protein EC957_010498 [Mortierella hygrophila]